MIIFGALSFPIRILFCSLAVLDPMVGCHTMDISYFLRLSLSSVILIDSSTGSCVHVLMLSIVVFLACVHLALFLALSLSPGNSVVSYGVTIVC